ncbi:MAG: heavy metal sensor histidine kinase [Terriglobia bacterium]
MSWKSAFKLVSTALRPFSRPWSLAARLTLWYAASAFALVLLATGFLYWGLVTNLDREDDQILVDTIQALRTLLRDRPGDAAALKQEAELEWAAHRFVQIYVRIQEKGTHSIIETPGMGDELAPSLFPRSIAVDVVPEESTQIVSRSGKPFRVLAAEATIGGSPHPTHVIHVALDRSHDEVLLIKYRRLLWLVLTLSLFVCSASGYGIARRGMRPVERIASAASQVRSTTLQKRIDVRGLPAELSVLAETFNDMLKRLDDSFTRLSRFSADIAHELRTPVNNMRGEAEVALSTARSLDEYREVLSSSLEECDRLSRMIDSLLFLSRTESFENPITREMVIVRLELETVREFYEAAASEAGITLRVSCPGGLVAELNRTLFQRAVANLVSNALAHTAKGGSVHIGVTRGTDSLRVVVSDTGCGIPAEHLAHVFDRFYRVDRARSKTSGGVGLGLAIVKSIAMLHGGLAEISSEAGRGTEVSLLFPQMTKS